MANKGRSRSARRTKTSPPAAKATPMDAIVAYLKAHPKAAYADVRAAAEKAGHTIYPIMFGRAKAMLGLLPRKPRVRRAAVSNADATGAATGARRPRPRRRSTSMPVNASLEQIRTMLEDYERVKRERDALRACLSDLQSTIAKVTR